MTGSEAKDAGHQQMKGRVAVIGAGMSGIGAANVWQRCGYQVTIFDSAPAPGGQWLQAYPGVSLQNTYDAYHFPTFPWPFQPDRHPSRDQVLRYIDLAIDHYQLDVRCNHRLINTKRNTSTGDWEITIKNEQETFTSTYCYLVLAVGQYPWGEAKHQPSFPNREAYQGRVVTTIDSVEEDFGGKKVAVVGFGKTALDFATWSAKSAKVTSTTHVFRTPRWTIPASIGGVCYTRILFPRFSTDWVPSWCHSSPVTKFLHSNMQGLVNAFWCSLIATIISKQYRSDARISNLPKEEQKEAMNRLAVVTPPKTQFVADLRSAVALLPVGYMPQVASGKIKVKHTAVEAFTENGLKLSTGEEVEADVVCLCCGNTAPTYSAFFDESSVEHSVLKGAEARNGGIALYRHAIHPSIPNLGFAGNNHGFVHTALVEVGSLWMVAAFEGDLELPNEKEQLASIVRVADFKTQHSAFEATGNLAVSTRFQQYLDCLCLDLGLSPWRKLPNPLAEYFVKYGPTDYAGCVDEYLEQRNKWKLSGEKKKVAFEADL